MIRPVAAAALLSTLLTLPAAAGERKLYENVKGWEVEINVGKSGPNPCQMAYSYKDKDDEDAENAIAVTRDGQKLGLVVGYENWGWDKGEKVQAGFAIDKQILYAKQGWVGDGTILMTQLPEEAADRLAKGRKIILHLSDGTADFSIPGFADAFETLKRCDAATSVAAAAPKVAETPMPDERRAKAYATGLIIQDTIGRCEVSTTAGQRNALDGKVAALRPEMGRLDAVFREELGKPGGAPACPTGAETAEFDTALKAYLDLGPEDFVAFADRQAAEQEAKRRTEAEAKAKAEAEARMRAEIEATMRAEAEAKSKAEADARARAEMEARIRSEVEAKLRAEAQAKEAEKAEAAARMRAEAEAKAEPAARTEAGAKPPEADGKP